MLFIDLYRYNTTTHQEHSEDFLSSILAAVMRSSPAVAEAVLQRFKNGKGKPPRKKDWRPPVGATSVRVSTQGTWPMGDTVARPDIVVRSGARLGLIECKHEAPPDIDQVRRYKRIPRAQVAFLAPEAVIRNLDDRDNDHGDTPWAHVPRASWQAVGAALMPFAGDDVLGWQITQFLALLEELDLAGRRDLSRADVQHGIQAWTQLDSVEALLQQAIRAILTPDCQDLHGMDAKTHPTRWHNDGPLDVWWERERAKPGELSMLGLTGTFHDGDLDPPTWVLSLSPVKVIDKASRRPGRDREPIWQAVDGFLQTELPISDATDLVPSLRAAVVAARALLKSSQAQPDGPIDMGVGRIGLSALTSDARPDRRVLLSAETLSGQLWAWESHTLERLGAWMQQEIGTDDEDGHHMVATASYVYLLDGTAYRLSVWFDWDTGTSHATFPSVSLNASWTAPKGAPRNGTQLAQAFVEHIPEGGPSKAIESTHAVLRLPMGDTRLQHTFDQLFDAFTEAISADPAFLPPYGSS